MLLLSLRLSSFVFRSSSFVLRLSSFVFRPSSFVLRLSSFVFRPSSLSISKYPSILKSDLELGIFAVEIVL